MNLLFIPSLLAGDYRTFFLKMSIVFGMWLIVVIAAGIDLRTGIQASKRIGNFRTTSKGLRQTMKKLFEYFAFLTIALLFDFILSYLTTLTDIITFFGLFRIPLFTIASIIIILIIEGISVKENTEKGRGKDIISPELINKALDILGQLGDEKVKAISEILKTKEK
ncbi:MAG TPA: hypothetical protein VK152_06705 [Paludibacter sp.]|nr:hypothetical protein [Paludibacter sp.]